MTAISADRQRRAVLAAIIAACADDPPTLAQQLGGPAAHDPDAIPAQHLRAEVGEHLPVVEPETASGGNTVRQENCVVVQAGEDREAVDALGAGLQERTLQADLLGEADTGRVQKLSAKARQRALVRLDDRHLVTRGRERRGGGEPGEPSSDHDDVGVMRPHRASAVDATTPRSPRAESSAGSCRS